MKLGNLEQQCFEHFRHCNGSSGAGGTQAADLHNGSLRSSRGVARELADSIAGSGLSNEKEKQFEKVRTMLRNHSARLEKGEDAHAEHCVSRTDFLDTQVEAQRVLKDLLAAKQKTLVRDKDGAMAFQELVRAGVKSLQTVHDDTVARCKEASSEIAKQVADLRKRRIEFRSRVAGQRTTTVSDCHLTDWRPAALDGICSKTCGGGVRAVEREVLRLPSEGGDVCPRLLSVELSCNSLPCPRDCATTWGEWSLCSATCGDGVRVRRRTIQAHAVGGGQPCGPPSEVEPCGGTVGCGGACKRSP